jgi:hypothetical protein
MTPACPITATQDALTLLRSGRAAMALRILEGLPALIEAQLVDVRGSGFAEGWDAHLIAEAHAKAPSAAQTVGTATAVRPRSRLDTLREALADPEQRARLRAVLRMEDWLLDRIAAGTATLSGTQWRKLREALA